MSITDKILPWLSIRSKLIIAFVGLSIIPLALVGIYFIFSNVQMMQNNAIDNLNHDVNTIREKAGNFLAARESDLNTIRNSIYFENLISKMSDSEPKKEDILLQQISTELLSFCKTKRIYYQIRVIYKGGNELFKIENLSSTDSLSNFQITPIIELKNTRETYYFLMVKNLSQDHIAFSPAELIDKNAERIPVISFAMPLEKNSKTVGILIANVYAKEFFNVIETRPQLQSNGNVVLVNDEGYYFYHSEKKKDWNKLLASRDLDNLHFDYPDSVGAQILSGKQGIISKGLNEIISFAPLFPDSSNEIKIKLGGTTKLFVFESVPKNIIMAPIRSFVITFGSFLITFLLVAIGLGLLATRQFTQPILALQRGAEIIAEGNYNYRLKVKTNDEIQKLASQFNIMAASLETRTHELQEHRSILEDTVKQRTSELTEEKLKLRAIIDNVPSAFVLLDKDYRIKTASVAFTAITGYSLNEVLGKNCNFILYNNRFFKERKTEISYNSGTTEIYVNKILDDKGNERFIEQIIIPIKEEGQISSILEIITDITKRKQLEQNLIHSEKLIAAGEMSAIIAHEFRNLLTSVKIIIQLQNETTSIGESEKYSLGVALNSIDHMESIVNELLNFASPKSMEFKPTSLNYVINESIKFVQSQINKQNISLNKEIVDDLPNLMIDESHFKEALINVLLNATQAFNYNISNNHKKEINIFIKKVNLKKTLHDFSFEDNIENKDEPLTRKEIILKKGSACALIEINDNGSGIENKDLSRIFDPFFTTKPNGTGLGLPMVKRTINAHNGIITAESQKRKGTTFNLFLPIKNL